MKKIILAIILFIGINTNLNAVTIDENKQACNTGNVIGCYNLVFDMSTAKN